MNKADLDYVRSRYQTRIASVGVGHASMNSGTEAKQATRHAVHASIVGSESSVLDFGCGIGSFLEALRSRGCKGPYLGIDIVPEYVKFCEGKFHGERFELRDIFDQGWPEESFDAVVASQVFNARYPESDNLEVAGRFLQLAVPRATVAVSVDFLSSYVDFRNPELFYFEPEKVLSLGKSLCRRVRLLHDYLPFEFTLQLFLGEG